MQYASKGQKNFIFDAIKKNPGTYEESITNANLYGRALTDGKIVPVEKKGGGLRFDSNEQKTYVIDAVNEYIRSVTEDGELFADEISEAKIICVEKPKADKKDRGQSKRKSIQRRKKKKGKK